MSMLNLSLVLSSILSLTMMFITLLLGLPVLWFCIQIAFALLPARVFANKNALHKNTETSPRIAVLVPAHNESHNLIPTLQALLSEKNASTRILVVADNCTDDTAAVARHAGAEVIERTNATLSGKGYALDFGIQYLSKNPPDVLVVIDADCLPAQGAVQAIANLALEKARPVQALYLMRNVVGNSVSNSVGESISNTDIIILKKKIAEFAWLVKNQVRPRGMSRVGLACQLTGSGMAFPWPVLQEVSLATGNIVEDMKLGMELTERGHPPLFSEQALVTSTFPSHEDGVRAQRTRWEHGHLSMLIKTGIPKLAQGLLHRNWALFFLALDLCIPPLALLVMSVCVWVGLGGFYWIASGDPIPLGMGMGYLLSIGVFVTLAWNRFGRHIVSALELLKTPWYVLGKLPIYTGYLFRRQAQWVRAKRDNEKK